MGKRFGMAAAVLVLVVLSVPAVASAKPVPLVCGPDGFINVATNLKLTEDFTCNLGVIGSPVVIDLHGHTLTGEIDGNGHHTVTVKNGRIDGQINATSVLTVDRVTVNGDIGDPFNGTEGMLTVRRSTVSGTLANGYGATTVLRNNVLHAVILGDEAQTINATIAGNVITGSAAAGIFINASNSPIGDDLHGTISDNVIAGNAGDGIWIVGAPPLGPFGLRHNVIVGNGGHGVNADQVVLSAHHNVITGNATDPQCVALVC